MNNCLPCIHSYPYIEKDKIVCTKDIDLRRVKLEEGKPKWCPLVEKDPLEFVKSC